MNQYIFSSRTILFSLLFILPFLLGSSNRVIDEQEQFYLSNYTTFAPGNEVIINLYLNTKSRQSFKMRLLKIDDPVQFFLKADRNLLKYRFDILSTDKGNLLDFTSLVKTWEESISPSPYYGYSKNVNAGKINEPGIYIVQAIRNNLVAYCGVVVTDYAMIYKSAGDQVLAVLTNSGTGEFQEDVQFSFFHHNKLVDSKTSGKDGIVLLKTIKSNPDDINRISSLIIAEKGKEVILNDPYLYFHGRDNELTAYIYTSQPVYRPGQEVSFKSIFRRRAGNDLQNAAGEKFTITIKSPRNKEVYSEELSTNDFGTISGNFTLDEEADLGNYSININRESYQYQGSFSVEEYKKPEYIVKINTGKSNYSRGDLIEGIVSADYYFGSPVTEGNIHLYIYRKNYWRPWWYWSPYSWFYRGYGMEKIPHYGNQQLIHEETAGLNKEGKFTFNYKADEDVEYDYVYTIRAEVTDNSRRSVSGTSDVYITRGSFSIFTTPDKYFVQSGKTVNLRVNAADFSDMPVETDFVLKINFPDTDPSKDRPPHQVTLNGRTDIHGKAVIPFITPADIKGHFNYTVTSRDEKGREITNSSSFFTGNTEDYYYGRGGGLEIVTDKDAYEKGDSLIAFVFIPQPGTDVLLTYESSAIIHYKKVHASGSSFTIKEKLDKKFAPGFNISISLVKERQFYTTSKMIGVLDKDRILNIAVNPGKEIYKPGEEAHYFVTVKDNKGNAAANTELSFGLVDESIYAIRADETQPIHNFFFAPAYYYIPTYNSLQTNYYNGSSRKATVIDKDLLKDSESRRGDSRLYGKVNYKSSDKPAANIELFLSGEEGFYKTTADTSGSYSFNNIKKGNYELYKAGGKDLLLIKEIEVKKATEFNFEVDEIYSDVEGLAQTGVVANGEMRRRDAADMMFAPMEKMKMESKEDYVQPEIRSDFRDAAFWRASLVTDRNGKAEVKVKLPDNLTTWRATVKGITKTTEAGEERNTVIARKDLLVRMETPRFFRQGDELVISTLVHNYLEQKKTVRIKFSTNGVELLSSEINSDGFSNKQRPVNGSYEVSINKNSEVRIDWKVKVDNPAGKAKLFAEALTNEESDAMELEIPILPKGFRETDYTLLNIADQFKEEKFTFNIPSDVDLRTAKYIFSSSPSMSGTLLKAVDELAGYPYGCVEQTMSRFLPTIVAANTFKEINIPVTAATLEELPQMVDAGLKRLYSFQHEDGGWGWWTNDQTNPYMTAYVIYGMSLAKKAGYTLNENIFSKGIENLKSQIQSGSGDNSTTLAFMLYSLSTAYDLQRFNFKQYAGKIDELLGRKLNPYSLALLGLAAKNWDSRSAGKIADRITELAVQKDNLAYWTGENWHYNWQEDKVQSTAFAVKALINLNGQSELIEKAVRWLLIQKQGFSWHSTQETAAVVFALSDYLRLTGELDPDFNVKVFVNGKEASSSSFSYADILKEPGKFAVYGNDLRHGTNEVTITKEGKGKLYFSGISEYYTMNERSAAKYNSFNIRREYYPLKTEQRGENRLVYVKDKFNGNVTSGQEILVKTYVETKDEGLQYFVLEDMIPSGFEPVKDEQNFEIEGENNYKYYDPYMYHRPWIWHYADKEYRDEKVAFFVTQVNGTMEFSYIIKAQIPGEYTIAPALGYLMYYPEVGGHSGMTDISVK